MTGETVIFLKILLVNLIIALIYLIIGVVFRRKKEGAGQYVINTVIMLLCPVVGAAFLFISWVIRIILSKLKVNLDDVIFSKERAKTHVRADEEKESNVVPMEEALAISDTASLRQYMLNVLMRDISNSLFSISEAVSSNDPETAHYAASVLSERLNEFRLRVQKMYGRIMELHNLEAPSPESVEEMCRSIFTLVIYMEQTISQNVFTALEQESYTRMMNEICDILYEEKKDTLTIEFYDNAILRLLDIKEYEKAKMLSERAMSEFPDNLASYTSSLRLYFALGDKDMFYYVIDKLKESGVAVDKRTSELIKLFTNE